MLLYQDKSTAMAKACGRVGVCACTCTLRDACPCPAPGATPVPKQVRLQRFDAERARSRLISAAG